MNSSNNGKARNTLALTIAGMLVLGVGAMALEGQEASGASAENGKVAYRAAGCQRCHGQNGQDGTEGPPLAPEPIPYEDFAQVVRAGKGGGMPAFDAAKLTDSDLADIYAFLKAVQ